MTSGLSKDIPCYVKTSESFHSLQITESRASLKGSHSGDVDGHFYLLTGICVGTYGSTCTLTTP